MKNIAYHIIVNIGFILTIPLALASSLCLIMVGLHKVAYTLVNLAFDREDPYWPMRDLVKIGKDVHDAYSDLYNIF